MHTTFAARAIRILATALVAAAAAPVYAQTEQLVANVPFDFVVGTEHLTAGKYLVRPASDDPSVLMVEGADRHGSAVVLTIPREDPTLGAPAAPGLTFKLRDGERVLARVVDGDGTEREIIAVR
jgi:hypothetical protein